MSEIAIRIQLFLTKNVYEQVSFLKTIINVNFALSVILLKVTLAYT